MILVNPRQITVAKVYLKYLKLKKENEIKARRWSMKHLFNSVYYSRSVLISLEIMAYKDSKTNGKELIKAFLNL